jgi:hypothetical protein
MNIDRSTLQIKPEFYYVILSKKDCRNPSMYLGNSLGSVLGDLQMQTLMQTPLSPPGNCDTDTPSARRLPIPHVLD